MKKVFISTPCYDATLTMQYTISLLKLTQLLSSENIEYVIDFIGNESLITRARNNSLGRFMKSDYSHILFIDSDLEFDPYALLENLKFDKDVVCCTYPKKGFNWKRFFYSMSNEKSNESPESRGLDYTYNLLYKDNKIVKKDNFVRVRHASTGFMLVKREIVEKLSNFHKELNIVTCGLNNNDNEICGLFCCMIKDKQYLSEDYSFCQRVHDIGGEIWINISQNLNHVGRYIFRSDIKNRKKIERSINERMFYE